MANSPRSSAAVASRIRSRAVPGPVIACSLRLTAPESNCQRAGQDGKDGAHDYPFEKPNMRPARRHLVLREQRAEDRDERDRDGNEPVPQGQRFGLSEPPYGSEDVGVEEVIGPNTLRQQR